ncbi:MAG: 5'-nucleotidase C-terminal domain-containing protein [Oscillospiraceae bacterium]|nr:5'-nucleotidase C-terminal domain-containing protein [Oscillospiraceae bacterium]
MERKLGELQVDLNCEDCNAENGLYDFLADAYRAAARTQAALVGEGSVRTDLSAGEVTYQDVLDILPYYHVCRRGAHPGHHAHQQRGGHGRLFLSCG